MITAFIVISFVLAAFAAGQFFRNLPMFIDDIDVRLDDPAKVSILIPARDEESGIRASVQAAVSQSDSIVEVIVLDDQSTDQTAAIVQEMSQADDRIRYELGKPLPPGWNGKQHACYLLAQLASYENLLFLDADVRLEPTAVSKLIAYRDQHDAKLLSAFPKQETGMWLEKWLIPLMHYILLCYLPFDRMRSSTSPAYASGCGQLFLTDKASYQAAGTHQSIASSRHDGLKLPKAYRRSNLSTDVIDGTSIATCRMYRSASEVVRGALKNATEGIANAKMILPFTVLLLGGSVLPLVLLVVCIEQSRTIGFVFSMIAVVLGHLPRAIGAKKFELSILGVVCHAPSVVVFISLQWIALLQSAVGYQVKWRGRD